MKAVVLGASGFVGRHVCEAFTAAGELVLPVARSEVDLISPDGPDKLARLVAEHRPDVVVNAAGRAWRANERQMIEGNADLVDRLLEALLGQPHRTRLIQLGTVHEYGPGVVGTGTNEDHPTSPATAYGRSKLLGSQSVLAAVGSAGLDGVVLRVANVCGPGSPKGSLLGSAAEHLADSARAQADGTPPTALRFASLRAWRDYVDATDVAAAVLAAARAPAADVTGQVLNIGRGQAVQARWLIDRMVALSGLPVPVVEDDGDDSRSDVEWQQLDISKAGRVLGWLPRRDLDDSLRDLLDAA